MVLSKMTKQYMIDNLNDIVDSLRECTHDKGIPIYKGYTHFDVIMTASQRNNIENQIEKLKDMINDE